MELRNQVPWCPYEDLSHQIQVSSLWEPVHVRPRWDHSHQVLVWFMWERESPGPGEVPMGTTVTRSGEAMLRIRVISYR